MQTPVIFLLDNSYWPDNRVENEINALIQRGYKIEMHCVANEKLAEVEEHEGLKIIRSISPLLHKPFSSEYRNFVKKFVSDLARKKIDIIHCHDFRMLLLAGEIKRLIPSIKIIYDSHEYLLGYPYYSRTKKFSAKFKGMLVWLWYVWKESVNFKNVDRIITVSESIRQFLEKRSGKKSFLIRNIPTVVNTCEGSCNYWHEKFNLSNDMKVMVHTGNAHFSEERLILLLDALTAQGGIALVFLGTNQSVTEIQQIVAERGYKNIYFHEQIPRKYITYYCSQAQFGLVYTWNRKWKSYWYALPNKLMDVSLAGIPVLATNQPEIAKFIDQFNHGVKFNGDDYNSIRNGIKALIKNEDLLKSNAQKITKEVSWEKEKQVLYQVYESIGEG